MFCTSASPGSRGKSAAEIEEESRIALEEASRIAREEVARDVSAGFGLSVLLSLGVSLAVYLLSGCSSMLDVADSPQIICHDTKEPLQCPTKEGEGARAARAFSKFVMPLADDEPLTVHWYDWDHEFADVPGDVVGYSRVDRFPQEVHVRNTRVLMHEFAHVALDREAGNPDDNHEKAPGPWGEAINVAIELAADEFGTTNGVVYE